VKSTLTELLKSLGGAIPDGKRVYKVTTQGELPDCREQFVLSNSPAKAALQACDVETVKPKDIQAAALAALAELAKGES